MNDSIVAELKRSAETITHIDPAQIRAAADLIIESFRNGGQIIFMGNGGSSADAQHIAAEFSGRYMMERPALPSICLSNIAPVTAIGNDYTYDIVFKRQIEANCRKGDVVVATDAEHNSNHVPWLYLRDNMGVERRMSRSRPDGSFDMESFQKCMDSKVKVVSVQHCNNVTGCTIPIRAIAEIAHDRGALVMVDGAQAAPHMAVDLKKADVDIYCMSIHKMLGPTGMGVMYGKREVLEKLRPMTLGGGTVGLATYDSVNLAPIPDRFEAGLHNYAGIIGTKAALDYLSKIGMDEIERWDTELMRRLMSGLEDIRNLHPVGPTDPDRRGSVFSFNIDGLGAHDIAMMLDSMAGIMIRSGMHCAHPFYVSRGIDGSARASVYLYNSLEEMDIFTDTVRNIAETFGD